VVRIVRFVCCNCGAVWQVLPLLIARLLRSTWRVVEASTLGPAPPPTEPQVPARTLRRWRERLGCAARHAVQVLATSGDAALERLAGTLGLDATRCELVLAYAYAHAYAHALDIPCTERLASVAALLHRLAPGARLM
jgi:hypothetical protein